ncbi:TPA: hypothetical protein ACFP4Y_001688 [Neisseria bacilliformis]|uniref:hypothetical protein n=1 Tax=Neisseria bacilliformis TaxID=267212 RepID=UPI000A51D075|nr:hypothetical protein [Neisseria bacilliformis]
MLKLRFSDGLYPAGRVCGAATHAVFVSQPLLSVRHKPRASPRGDTPYNGFGMRDKVFRRPPSRKRPSENQ